MQQASLSDLLSREGTGHEGTRQPVEDELKMGGLVRNNEHPISSNNTTICYTKRNIKQSYMWTLGHTILSRWSHTVNSDK